MARLLAGSLLETLPFSMIRQALESGLVGGQQNVWANILSFTGGIRLMEMLINGTNSGHSSTGRDGSS